MLCQPCNVAKGDKDVEVVDVELTFPLRPPPSGDYESLIWLELGRRSETRRRQLCALPLVQLGHPVSSQDLSS